MNEIKFNTIEEAIEDFKNGKPIIVADDEDRENEGDVIIPAQFATPQIINFLISECKGVVCLSLTREKAEEYRDSGYKSDGDLFNQVRASVKGSIMKWR